MEVEEENRPSSALSCASQAHGTIAADLDVHIVKFFFDTPNRVIRGLWVFFLLIGVLFCAYYIAVQVIEYQSNPTVTKVSLIRQDTYDYPPIILCIGRNWNPEKARKANLSYDAQVYALTLIRNPLYYREMLTAANVTLGETQFHEFAKQHGFETYRDFFEWISLDSEQFLIDGANLGSRHFEKMLVAGPYYDDSMMNTRICHRVDAKPYNPAGSIFDVFLSIPKDDGGFGSSASIVAIKYDTRLSLQQEVTPIRENRHTAIRLSAAKYIKLPSENCVDMQAESNDGGPQEEEGNRNPVPERSYFKEYCRHRCFSEAVAACTGCRLLEKDTAITPMVVSESPSSATPLLPLCTFIKNPKILYACKETGDTLQKCYQSCKKPCQFTVFHRTDAQTLLNGTASEGDVTNISLSIDYRVDQGLLVYEELSKFTFDTLVSEVGGQMGLWVGASILFVFEFFFLLGQWICPKKGGQEEGMG